MLLIADGVAGGGVLEAHCRGDITGIDLLQLHSLVCVHLQDTSHSLLLALRGIEDIGAGVQRTGVHAEESKSSDEGIRDDLECECGERLLIGGLSLVLFAVHRRALDRRDVRRCRHILDDSVEELLDALVEVRGTAAHRDSQILAGTFAERLLQLVDGRLFSLKILLHQVLIKVADLLHHLGVPLLRLILHILRNVDDGDILALGVVVNVSLHLHHVDQALEVILLADGQLDADRVLAETMLDLVDCHEEVCAHDVHLVDEGDTRDMISVRLTPHVLGLGLNASLRVEDADGAVKHAERALDLDGKIHVAGGVDDVDAVLQRAGLRLAVFLQRPVAGGSSGGNGNTSLLLLLHVVHCRGALIGLTDLVVHTGIVQNTLGKGRLSCVDMRHDTDISGSLEGVLSFFNCSHLSFLLNLLKICSAQTPCLPRPSCAYLLFS